MNDFASQDYIDKNIRIRPHSGKSIAEDPKPSAPFMKEENEEDDTKMIQLEMEEQRREIKRLKDEVERKVKAEEEKKKKR